jgi:uncharacterized protein YqgC (DUF456 family)
MAFLAQVWEFIKATAWMPMFFAGQMLALLIIPLGWPGLWLQVLLAFSVTLLTGHVGWFWSLAILMLAVLGEVLDQILGALGFSVVNASKLASWCALFGGFIFAFFGSWIPIPILGSLIMSFIGTFVGAIFGEILHQRKLKPHLKVAFGAILGRVCGIAAKLSLGFAACLIAIAAVLWELIWKAAGH